MADILKKITARRAALIMSTLALGACSTYANYAPTGYTAGHPDPLLPPGYEQIIPTWENDGRVLHRDPAPGVSGETTTSVTTTYPAVETTPMPEPVTPMAGAVAPPTGITREPGAYGYVNP